MRKHKTRLAIFPVGEDQLDEAVRKFVRMMYEVRSKEDVLDLKKFTDVLAAQLRQHNLPNLSDTVISSYFEELGKYEGITT
jgi:hypothetical protein